MPIHCYLLPEYRLIVSQWIGQTTDEMMTGYYRKICQLPDTKQAFTEIVDLRQAQGAKGITVNGLMEVGKIVKDCYNSNPVEAKVMVIAPNYLTFGMARMYQGLASPESVNFEVFRTSLAAVKALNLPIALSTEIDDLDTGNAWYFPLGLPEENEEGNRMGGNRMGSGR